MPCRGVGDSGALKKSTNQGTDASVFAGEYSNGAVIVVPAVVLMLKSERYRVRKSCEGTMMGSKVKNPLAVPPSLKVTSRKVQVTSFASAQAATESDAAANSVTIHLLTVVPPFASVRRPLWCAHQVRKR